MADARATAQRLRVLVGRLRRTMQDASSVGDLTAPQASALARLTKTEPLSTSELAVAERVRPQSMAKTVASLQAAGLVRREADADDGRRQLLFLTDQGRAYARGAQANREEWLAEAFDRRYTDAERRTIDQALLLLERLVDP